MENMNNKNMTTEKFIALNTKKTDPSYADFLLVMKRVEDNIKKGQISPYQNFWQKHQAWTKSIAGAAVFGVMSFTYVLTQNTALAPSPEMATFNFEAAMSMSDSDILMSDLGSFADDLSFVDDQIDSDILLDTGSRKGSQVSSHTTFV